MVAIGCRRLKSETKRNEKKQPRRSRKVRRMTPTSPPRREGPVISGQRERHPVAANMPLASRSIQSRRRAAIFYRGEGGGYPEISGRIRTVRLGGSHCQHSRHHWLFVGLPRRIRPSTDLRDFTGRILATGRPPDTRVSYGGGQPQVSRVLPWSVRNARGLEGSESEPPRVYRSDV